MVKFNVTPEQEIAIHEIAVRADEELFKPNGIRQSILDTTMDLSATIAQGVNLDLEKLLAFDAFNFSHDVGGIYHHIDRNTGHLRDCFLPRCAA